MDSKKPIDLDALDRQLLAELEELVAEGDTTREEADRLADIIRRTGGGGK